MNQRLALALAFLSLVTVGDEKPQTGLIAQSIPAEGNGRERAIDTTMPEIEAVGGTARMASDGTVLLQPYVLAQGLQGESDSESCLSVDSCSSLGENSGSCRIFDASSFEIPSEPQTEPPLSGNQLANVSKAQKAVQYAGISEPIFSNRQLLDAAIAAKRESERQNREDQLVVSKPYSRISRDRFSESLSRAMDRLGQAVDVMRLTQSGISDGERARFQNLFSNARDQTQNALNILAQEKAEDDLKQVAAFKGFLDPTQANPLGRTQGLQDLFGKMPVTDRPGSQEALLQRTILFAGLPDAERDEMRKRLNFLESPDLELKNGSKVKLDYLHNGYVWGGGKSGVDCSQLATSVLPDGINRSNFTSLEFYLMWQLIRQNVLPKPPELTSAREKLIRRASSGFQAINIYQRQKLQPGDILTFRIPNAPGGHVFIVRTFDPKSGLVKVIEAAQSAGTVRERDYSLYVNYQGKKFVKPGFTVLRIKNEENPICSTSMRNRGGA